MTARDEAVSSAAAPADAAAWEEVIGELTAAMHAQQQERRAEVLPSGLAERLITRGEQKVRPVTIPPRRTDIWRWSGWLAAALLTIWVSGTQRAGSAGSEKTRLSAASPITTRQLRDSLIRTDPSSAPVMLSTLGDTSATNASGDVVWSARTQAGVLRLVGLQPNDRTRWQYQLWIFDKRRDQRYPVDGGVFDVAAGAGEVLVAIRANVPVGEAGSFAITVEKVGGVVVSARERIALLGKSGA